MKFEHNVNCVKKSRRIYQIYVEQTTEDYVIYVNRRELHNNFPHKIDYLSSTFAH